MKGEEYLPKELQDFHDQKELFKDIQQEKTPNNWVDNHIYTIDYFLYYMAKFKYLITDINIRHLHCWTNGVDKATRQEATELAIIKANEIYNERNK